MAELVVKLVNGELAGKTAQEIAKQIRDAGTAARKAEVGTKAWIDAHAKLDKAKALQEDLRKQVEATTGASNLLKNAWIQLPGAQFFNQIAQSFGLMKGAVGGLTGGFKILKFAIAATGLGILVVLLGSLFTWFQKTERGADFLSKAMAAAGAAVNVLIDRASKLIDALIAFTKGDWSEAAKKFGEATSGVTEEIMAETKAAWELADALDKLEELEGKLILLRSRTKQQVSELRLLSKDETKSFADRSAAIEKAIALTRQLTAQEREAKLGRVLQALQVKDLTALQKQYGVTLDELMARGEDILTVDNLGMGESTQDDLNAAFEAIAAYNEALAASNDAERTLVMDLNTLKKKSRTEDKKDSEQQRRAEAEALKKQREALEEEYRARENLRKLESEKRLALIEDEREREIEALNITTEEKITALQGSEAQILEQIKLLRDIQGAELAAIDKKWADKKAAEDKKAKLEQEQRDKEHAEKQAEIRQMLADAEAQVEEIRLDTFRGGVAGFGDLLAQQIKDEKEARKVRKAFALADIGIGLSQELAANSAAGAKIAAQAPPFTVPAGIAYTAAANTRSVIRAGLATAKVLLFKKGGYTGEGPVDEPAGVVHRKEYVIPAHITQDPKYSGIINNLEAARLKGYEAGGPVNPFSGRNAAPSVSSTRQPSDGNINFDRMERLLVENLDAINARIDRIKVVNVVTETEAGIKTINSIKAEADV